MFKINNFPIFNTQVQNMGFRASNPIKQFDGGIYSNDSFTASPIAPSVFDKYGDEKEIIKAVNSNERLKELLDDYNVPLKVNLTELDKLKKGHLAETRVVASKICSQLPKELRQEVNQSELQQAAMLHDFGKILIPDRVLNKPDSLNTDERGIMQLHSEIGYELLKDSGELSENTLNMIKYHHQTPTLTGYPNVNNEYDCTRVDNQILNIADKFSALTEKRSYKDAYTKEEALAILKQDMDNGEFIPEVYEALQRCIQQNII